MVFAISSVAVPVRSARFRISSATTAKPRPCVPALAASIAAFKAKRFVWSVISAISSAAPLISFAFSSSNKICSTCFATFALISCIFWATSSLSSLPSLHICVAFWELVRVSFVICMISFVPLTTPWTILVENEVILLCSSTLMLTLSKVLINSFVRSPMVFEAFLIKMVICFNLSFILIASAKMLRGYLLT